VHDHVHSQTQGKRQKQADIAQNRSKASVQQDNSDRGGHDQTTRRHPELCNPFAGPVLI